MKFVIEGTIEFSFRHEITANSLNEADEIAATMPVSEVKRKEYLIDDLLNKPQMEILYIKCKD
ncbi:hypothetical protein [Pectinatus frisingensis]|uniref:hypothetical protein n=1 Tax=Pectinatus frisingensis TaxID=865 RepID=UPI0015F654D2|nr:hypothetical protein [Pectinatus frisingensis]